MSLRSLQVVLVACFVAGCGGAHKPDDEPQSAKRKQQIEAKKTGETGSKSGKKWSGWRYQGDRDDCFFVIGRRCFKTEEAACRAAKCQPPKKCTIEGGGPAAMLCK
jgi:hypothetical protein